MCCSLASSQRKIKRAWRWWWWWWQGWWGWKWQALLPLTFSWLRLHHNAMPMGKEVWESSLTVCPGQRGNISWNASLFDSISQLHFPSNLLLLACWRFTTVAQRHTGQSLGRQLHWSLMLKRASFLTVWPRAWRGWPDNTFFAASFCTALYLEWETENEEQDCSDNLNCSVL